VLINRRRALLVLAACCLAVLGTGSSLAQDPRASVVQKSARDWLMIADRGDGAAGWRAAGKQFQNALTSDQWAEALKKVRPPLGEVTDRTLASTEFAKSFPGVPDGDYALLLFRSSFAKKTDSSETVTLEREADGNWRVIGYLIR
jgi:hypothetical protein